VSAPPAALCRWPRTCACQHEGRQVVTRLSGVCQQHVHHRRAPHAAQRAQPACNQAGVLRAAWASRDKQECGHKRRRVGTVSCRAFQAPTCDRPLGRLATCPWLPDPDCSTAQHSAAQHSTAQHSTAQHSTAQHGAAQRSAAQHSTAQHGTARHGTARHSTAQSSTAQHSAMTRPAPTARAGCSQQARCCKLRAPSRQSRLAQRSTVMSRRCCCPPSKSRRSSCGQLAARLLLVSVAPCTPPAPTYDLATMGTRETASV
jgi:hypothetical protein